MSDEIKLRCFRCGKTPSELSEYHDDLEEGETPDDYVREYEGTLNAETGLFACTLCYVAIGAPSNPFPAAPWTP